MSAAYNDGALPYGSRVLTIDSITYIAENFEFTRPTQSIQRRNQLNEPSGAVYVDDFATGNAILQLAAATTAIPTTGQTFTTTVGSGSETFVLTEVGQPEAQGEAKKVNVNFALTYGS